MADFKKHLGILMNCYKNFFTQIGFISDCKNMILRAHIRLTSTRAELKLLIGWMPIRQTWILI